MDKELEKYRARIFRKYQNRRTGSRYADGGRRRIDYKSPSWFTWADTIQFLLLIGGGICLLFLAGCAYVKKTFLGG